MKLSEIKPQITTSNIPTSKLIEQDLIKHGYTGSIPEHLSRIAEVIKSKQGFVLRFSDTAILCVCTKPQELSIHLYTLDTIRDLAGAINGAVEIVKLAGIKRVGATTTYLKMVNMLQRMYPIEVTQHEDKVSWSLEISNEI